MIPAKVALILPRLATEHVGELVATRDALVRSLSAVGLDLHDLAAACMSPTETPARRSPGPSASGTVFGDRARQARDLDHGRLTATERRFVHDMVARGFRFTPSPRQANWLEAILDRLQGRAAA